MLRRVTFRHRVKLAEDEDTDPTLLKKNVVLKNNRSYTEDYKIHEYLGSGKFGEVKRCEEIRSGQSFAAKFVPIDCKDDLDSVRNEIAIMNRLRHPRLIQLCDAYQSPSEVVMVLELITGGELFERIIDESFDLNESRCRRFMNEILQGIEYIHRQGVLHLDLKPENILCLSDTSFKIKIIDFGLARFYDGKELCVLFGTPEFVSPEVISYEPVTPTADMWSVGVICYVMLSGLSPFMGDSQAETLANIMRTTFNFNYPEFDEISEAAQDFICNLLVKDPRKRMSASDCLQHHWIKRKKTLNRKGTVSKKRLKHFVYRRKWQKAVNAIIALQRMGVVLHHTNDSTNKLPVNTLPATVSTNIVQSSSTKPVTSKSPQTSSTVAKMEPTNNHPKVKERKISFLFGKLSSKRGSSDSNMSGDQIGKPKNPHKNSILSRFTKRADPVTDQSKPTKVHTIEEQPTKDVTKTTQVGSDSTKVIKTHTISKNRDLKPQGTDKKHSEKHVEKDKKSTVDTTQSNEQIKSKQSEHSPACSQNQTSTIVKKHPVITMPKPSKPTSSKKVVSVGGTIADRIGFFSNKR